MKNIYVLTLNNNRCKTTREELVSGLVAKGCTVTLLPSRLGDFDVVKVDGQPVARAFPSEVAMLAYLLARG